MPSGNSAAAFALAKLARLTGRSELEDMAARTVSAFAADMARGPGNYCMLLCALDFLLGPASEVAVAGERSASGTRELVAAVNGRFLPRTVLLLADDKTAEIAPFTAEMNPADGTARAYVCENFACREPVANPADLLRLLEGSSLEGT
jgi:hypothetical protein